MFVFFLTGLLSIMYNICKYKLDVQAVHLKYESGKYQQDNFIVYRQGEYQSKKMDIRYDVLIFFFKIQHVFEYFKRSMIKELIMRLL